MVYVRYIVRRLRKGTSRRYSRVEMLEIIIIIMINNLSILIDITSHLFYLESVIISEPYIKLIASTLTLFVRAAVDSHDCIDETMEVSEWSVTGTLYTRRIYK